MVRAERARRKAGGHHGGPEVEQGGHDRDDGAALVTGTCEGSDPQGERAAGTGGESPGGGRDAVGADQFVARHHVGQGGRQGGQVEAVDAHRRQRPHVEHGVGGSGAARTTATPRTTDRARRVAVHQDRPSAPAVEEHPGEGADEAVREEQHREAGGRGRRVGLPFWVEQHGADQARLEDAVGDLRNDPREVEAGEPGLPDEPAQLPTVRAGHDLQTTASGSRPGRKTGWGGSRSPPRRGSSPTPCRLTQPAREAAPPHSPWMNVSTFSRASSSLYCTGGDFMK